MRLRLHIHNRLQKLLDNLRRLLRPKLLNLLQRSLDFLRRLLLDLRVGTGVLFDG